MIKERIFTELVMNFTSAVWAQNERRATYKYSNVYKCGALAHFLQSLRRSNGRIVDASYTRALLQMHGIDSAHLQQACNTVPKISIFETYNQTKHKILITSFDETAKITYSFWSLSVMNGFVSKKEQDIIKIMEKCLFPTLKDELLKVFQEDEIQLLEKLQLIISHNGYFFSPLFFKHINKTTIDLISEYDIGSKIFYSNVEKIAQNPGIPLEFLDPPIQHLIKEGACVGILLPITIELGYHKKVHVFCNPQPYVNGDLAYETAAYFRFNELFAYPNWGVLKDPLKFLDVLLNKGEAGNATNIGHNYGPLEVKGVIKVIRGDTSGRYKMIGQKQSTLEEAKKILSQNVDMIVGKVIEPPTWVSDPATYRATSSVGRKMGLLKLKEILRDY